VVGVTGRIPVSVDRFADEELARIIAYRCGSTPVVRQRTRLPGESARPGNWSAAAVVKGWMNFKRSLSRVSALGLVGLCLAVMVLAGGCSGNGEDESQDDQPRAVEIRIVDLDSTADRSFAGETIVVKKGRSYDLTMYFVRLEDGEDLRVASCASAAVRAELAELPCREELRKGPIISEELLRATLDEDQAATVLLPDRTSPYSAVLDLEETTSCGFSAGGPVPPDVDVVEFQIERWCE